jgi:release factor glutamine methyltransferase
LTPAQADELAALCARRAAREPLQYIVGDWDFCEVAGLAVRAPVLIPRPETEELVGLAADALAHAAAASGQRPRYLEVGVGSGAISLALAARLPHAVGVGIDVSPAAVALAQENADARGVPASALALRTADFRDFALSAPGNGGGGVHVLVSNPPYIPDAELPGLPPEVGQWEDPRALAGGAPGGLGVPLALLDVAASRGWLLPGGTALLETHVTHPALLWWLLAAPPSLRGALRGPRGDATLDVAVLEGACVPLAPACGHHGGPGGSGTPPPEAAVAHVLAGLTPADLPALWEAAHGELGLRLRRHWVLRAAYTDLQLRPRFVALQLLAPGGG